MNQRSHFILSNRKVYHAFGRKYLHIENNLQPDLPLHFAYVSVPDNATPRTRITQPVDLVDSEFIERVVAETSDCKNVTLFIHGFHHLFDLSFKAEVFDLLVKKYCVENDAIGKFIFFMWPSTQSRHYLDDRAHAQGFYLQRNYAYIFKELYRRLNEKGIHFNLMVHSMGHRLLNGFLAEIDSGEKYFNKVFLLAADVPHKVFDTEMPGVIIRNRKNSLYNAATFQDDMHRHYNFTALSSIAEETHCYYFRYDRILLAGVAAELKREEEFQPELVNDCLSLGTIGGDRLRSSVSVKFHNTEELLFKDSRFGSFLNKKVKILKRIDQIYSANEIHDDSKWFAAIKSFREPWVQLHRYFVESDLVVEEICRNILRSNSENGVDENRENGSLLS